MQQPQSQVSPTLDQQLVVPAEPTLLDDSELAQVSGGMGPNGGWSITMGPNGGW
jgi:bacteriocin-like protein